MHRLLWNLRERRCAYKRWKRKNTNIYAYHGPALCEVFLMYYPYFTLEKNVSQNFNFLLGFSLTNLVRMHTDTTGSSLNEVVFICPNLQYSSCFPCMKNLTASLSHQTSIHISSRLHSTSTSHHNHCLHAFVLSFAIKVRVGVYRSTPPFHHELLRLD